MKAIVYDRFGTPAEVLQLRDVPTPEPGRGEVRVRMIASPVNPSDMLTVRGMYGKLPKLPATPGYEGVGRVEVAGPGLLARLRGLRPGRRVAVLNGKGGNWQEQVIIPARQAVPIPDDIPDEQAAAFFVNPATAIVMTRHVLRVPAGAWLLQTAAGSALGRMVIRLGRRHGFRTINVVRRREQAEELLRAGGDAAICSSEEDVPARVRALTGGAGASYALDPVGGDITLRVLEALAPRGRLLVYGTLAAEPIRLDPRLLIAGQKIVEGFWLSEWSRDQGVLTMLRLFRQIVSSLRDGTLATDVAASYPMEDIRRAVEEAEKPAKPGKVLLRLEGKG